MGKKSRRVRDGAQYSGGKTHACVVWKDGDDIKNKHIVTMERGQTIKDVKVIVESKTGVPVARQVLTVECGRAGDEREVPDHQTAETAIDSRKECFILREKRPAYEIQHDVPPPKPLSAYELFTTALEAQTSRATVEADAASIAAQWEALPDAFKKRFHDGAVKEETLYECHRKICSLSGERMAGAFFRDAREGGRGLGRFLSVLALEQEADVDALAYHVVYDDMRQGGETLSLRELRWRICGDARAARRAAKRSYVVDTAVKWKTRQMDMRDEREIPRMHTGSGRFISYADMDRFNKATAAARRNMGDDERKAFVEYSSLMLMPRFGAEGLLGALKGVGNWPRFRPYWHRVRRRVCAHCAKRVDLTEPRYLVCAGCGKARYCSEACQRADWAGHQKECAAGQPGWNAAEDDEDVEALARRLQREWEESEWEVDLR